MKRERRRRKSPPGNAAGSRDVGDRLRTAVDHHQSGRLREAETAYRDVLNGHPNNPDALHLLGLVTHQAGRLDEARAMLAEFLRVAEDDMAVFPGRKLAAWEDYWHGAVQYQNEADFEHLYDALVKAGLED